MTFEEIVKKYNAVEIPLTEEDKEIYVTEIDGYRFEYPHYKLYTFRYELANSLGISIDNIIAHPKALETEEGQKEYSERWTRIMNERSKQDKPKNHWWTIRPFE